jgi:transcriptional regulator GlxA family with amidase domain
LKNVAILLFDGAEELDFAGPLEVFGVTNRLKPDTIRVFTVGVSDREVQCVNGLTVRPQYSFQSCPSFDILVVPGGQGSRREMGNANTLAFIKKAAGSCELVASVCTGALILAGAGLLDGKRATTHWAALDELKKFANVTVDHQRFIHEGKIVTSGGISAGIDMALHLVGLFFGTDAALEVAHRMEYKQ